MRRMAFLALTLPLLATPVVAGSDPVAADAAQATRLPDLRCFFVQGRCTPGGAPTGQTLASPDQIHNVYVDGWGPPAKGRMVWKHVAMSAEWVAAAGILPAPVHCDTYLAFVKSQAGVPQELWCIDGTRLVLLWEMLDATHGRYWTRQDGSMGLVLFDGRFRTGTFLLNTTDEQHFACSGGAAVKTDVSPGVIDIETTLGPFDISNGRRRSSTVATLRQMGIVPGADTVADGVALPASWIQQDAAAGQLSGAQPVSLLLLQGYWAEITCPEGSDLAACAASAANRETVWLVRVGDESSGYARWMIQHKDWSTGAWEDPVLGGIGTTTSVVSEGSAPLLPAVPCR